MQQLWTPVLQLISQPALSPMQRQWAPQWTARTTQHLQYPTCIIISLHCNGDIELWWMIFFTFCLDAAAVDTCLAANLAASTITNAASVSPTVDSPDDTAFTISCDSGYSASTSSGTLECDVSGEWSNRPTCDGELWPWPWTLWPWPLTLIFVTFTYHYFLL